MKNVTRFVCCFYNHWIGGISTFLILTILYVPSLYVLSLLRTNSSWLAFLYLAFSTYILSSLEIKLINVLSDLLDSWTSKLQNKYRMHSWENANLNNIDRFYKIGWTDDYLGDLLKYLDKKQVLPSKTQIDSYLKENGSNGTINTISLKHYMEVKASKHVYHRNITLINVGKVILLVSTIAFTFTAVGATTDITVSFISFKNIHTGTIARIISKLPAKFIIISLTILIIITILFVARAFYNAKHLRYVEVIQQALADAYSIKS